MLKFTVRYTFDLWQSNISLITLALINYDLLQIVNFYETSFLYHQEGIHDNFFSLKSKWYLYLESI